MKQNILFVIHTYNTGGVVSSLRSILHSGLSLRYEFRVFSITRGYDHRKEFLKWDCGCNFLTESYFSDFADFPIGRKMEALPIKILKSVPCLREKLKQALTKFTIWRRLIFFFFFVLQIKLHGFIAIIMVLCLFRWINHNCIQNIRRLYVCRSPQKAISYQDILL